MPVELFDKGVGLGNDGVHARIYFNLRGIGLKSSVGAPKQGVGGFQCFLGTNIQPIAGDGPGVHGFLWIQPLDEPAGLVRIVAFSDVAANLCQRGARVSRKSRNNHFPGDARGGKGYKTQKRGWRRRRRSFLVLGPKAQSNYVSFSVCLSQPQHTHFS